MLERFAPAIYVLSLIAAVLSCLAGFGLAFTLFVQADHAWIRESWWVLAALLVGGIVVGMIFWVVGRAVVSVASAD